MLEGLLTFLLLFELLMSSRAYCKMLASGGHALHAYLLVRIATSTAMLGFLSAWMLLVLHGRRGPPPQPGRDIRQYARGSQTVLVPPLGLSYSTSPANHAISLRLSPHQYNFALNLGRCLADTPRIL